MDFREMVLRALVVFLLAIILFMCWLHACGRWRHRTSAENAGESITADEDIDQLHIAAMKGVQRRGLDKAMIDALPTFVYSSNDQLNLQGSGDDKGEEGSGGACCRRRACSIECPVCLCEFQDKERGRVLPNCKHRFHVDCIDTWLISSATCPVCRGGCGVERAGRTSEGVVGLQVITTPSSSVGVQYPTNVLFWGNTSLVSSRTSGDSTQLQAPAAAAPASTIIQIYTHEAQPLDRAAPPSLSSSFTSASITHAPSPSRLNSLRLLLSRDQRRLINDPDVITTSPPSMTPSPSITRLNSLRRLLSREKSLNDPPFYKSQQH